MKNTREGLNKASYLFFLKKLYQFIVTWFLLLSRDLVPVPTQKRGKSYSDVVNIQPRIELRILAESLTRQGTGCIIFQRVYFEKDDF